MKKIILLVSFMFIITGCNEKELILENDKVNLNEAVIAEKEINDIKISDTSVIYSSGITTVKFNLSSLNNIYIKQVKLIFKNFAGTEMVTLIGYIDSEIKEKKEIVITSDIDLTNAYDIEYIFE